MRSQIKYFLDRIYMSRIGIRLLAHQHIACTQKHLGDVYVPSMYLAMRLGWHVTQSVSLQARDGGVHDWLD